jgi:hypothetical protein
MSKRKIKTGGQRGERVGVSQEKEREKKKES